MHYVVSADQVPVLSHDEDTIRRFSGMLRFPVELRVPINKGRVISGYFDDLDRFVDQAVILSGGTAKGGATIPAVYVTLNPVRDDLLARRHNRVEDYARNATADEDIVRRHLLGFDIDSRRATGIMATAVERDLALARSREVMEYLEEQGFPPGLLGDSGNGGHGLNGLDLPNTPEVTDLIGRLLQHLHRRFSDDRAVIDTTVHNPAGIWKVYGTKVQKGDEVGDRRHRLATLIDVPEELVPVDRGLIEKVVGQDRKPAFSLPGKEASVAEARDGDTLDRHARLAQAVLAAGGIGISREKDRQGGVLWVLDSCPFCDNADRCAHVEVKADGKLCFACKHDSCKRPDGGRHGWQDLRERFDPDRDLGQVAEGNEAGQVAPEETARPRIVTNKGQLRDVTEQAVAAVLSYNRRPRLFRHGGQAVRVDDDGGEARVKELRHDDNLDVLASAADWKAARGSRSGGRPERLPQDRVVEHAQARRLDAVQAGDGVVHGADRRRLAEAEDALQHGPVVLAELVADVGQAAQHRCERPGRFVQEQAAVVQGVVAADADDEVRGVRRHPVDLPGHLGGAGPVPGQQRRLPASGQASSEVLDDRRPAGNVAAVVEDRVAEQDDMAHGLVAPRRTAAPPPMPRSRMYPLARQADDVGDCSPPRAAVP